MRTEYAAPVPPTLLSILTTSLAAQTARYMREGSPDMVAVAPGHFGRVLGWLWENGYEDHALELLAELIGQLRPRDGSARVPMSEILDRLPSALPHGMEPYRMYDLVERASEYVPEYFGGADLETRSPV